jgi:hypothetical protein
MKNIPLLVISLGLLASCSTIMKGQTQAIEVTTPGARDALCILDNGEFKYPVETPHTIIISKAAHDLTVTCNASGNRHKTVVFKKKFSETEKLNIVNGLAPGTIIDYGSGALYEYPDKIAIDFTSMPPRMYPTPTYQQDYEENPAIAGLEEFRPGKPSMLRDQHEIIPSLVKRPPGEEFLDLGMNDGEAAPEGGAVPASSLGAQSDQPGQSAPDLIRGEPAPDGSFVGGTNFLPDENK